MRESVIQTAFGKKNKRIGVFELKLCKGRSIRWDSVKDHQIEALYQAKWEGFYHKISDSLPVFGGNKHMKFTSKKPFDCFYIKTDAYVVVCFYVPRKKKLCYYIDIDVFIEWMADSERKSFREEEAKEMAEYVLNLNKR